MMRILFLQNDFFFRVGLMSLAAYLHERGHLVQALVFQNKSSDIAFIKDFSPDLIGFYVTSTDAIWTIQSCDKIKRYKNIPIVVGGPHPSLFPEFISQGKIDFLCRGEGEYALLALITALEEKSTTKPLANMVIKNINGTIERNELLPPIKSLDELPFPRWQIYQHYPACLSYYRFMYPIIVGRGCPGKCSFCCAEKLRNLYQGKGRYIRLRSPGHVISELMSLKKDLQIRALFFEDDCFLLNKKWLHEFAELYIREIRLPFTCQTLASFIDQGTADLLSEMGCRTVRMGLETGNEHLRTKVLNKRVSNDHIIQAGRYLKSRNIRIQTYNIFGLPGESVALALETYNLNLQIGTNFAWSSQLRPFPGTDIMSYYREDDVQEYWNSGETPKDYFQSSPQFKIDPAIVNLQQFIQLFLQLSLPTAKVQSIIYKRWLRFFHPLFIVIYFVSVMRINKIPLIPSVRMAFQARQYIQTPIHSFLKKIRTLRHASRTF